jgi:hypothetical protein
MKRATKEVNDMAPAQGASFVRGDYLQPVELARELDVSPRTLARWHVLRIGPVRTVCGKTVLYRREAVRQWLAACEEKRRGAR